jgi:hypothetical protein
MTLDDPIDNQDQAVAEFSSRKIAYRPRRFFAGLLLKLPDDLISVIDPARASDLGKLVGEQGRNLRRRFSAAPAAPASLPSGRSAPLFPNPPVSPHPWPHPHVSFVSAMRTQHRSSARVRPHDFCSGGTPARNAKET